MTDYALSSGNYMRPAKSPWGSFPVRNMPLSTGISSATIQLGQVVCLDVNSTTYQNCIIPSSLSSACVVSTAIVGIAAENPAARSSTNAQGTLIPVWDANPNVEFICWTRKGLLNSTCVGQIRDLEWDSTLGIQLINLGASQLTAQANRVIITGYGQGPGVPAGVTYASGDSGAAVLCRFLTKDPNSSLSTGKLLAFYA